jgi:alpha-mannosidase
MISLDDGKDELAVITDVTMGGSSMVDGELELMVHRRCQKDDHRGVQEPLNETMCGCNDIGAPPHQMGAHGHEGDGGCDCQGLTMRGSALVVLDAIPSAHAVRRELIETLNFAPTLAFAKAGVSIAKPTMSAIAEQLPPSVKLMTISSNYAEWNEGKVLLRFAHKFQKGEHPTASAPATFSLAQVFSKAGLRVTAAEEMLLTVSESRLGPPHECALPPHTKRMSSCRC